MSAISGNLFFDLSDQLFEFIIYYFCAVQFKLLNA